VVVKTSTDENKKSANLSTSTSDVNAVSKVISEGIKEIKNLTQKDESSSSTTLNSSSSQKSSSSTSSTSVTTKTSSTTQEDASSYSSSSTTTTSFSSSSSVSHSRSNSFRYCLIFSSSATALL
jgi:penicillin-binding protein 1A